MRISDWSSDVCSSDLRAELAGAHSRTLNADGQCLLLPCQGGRPSNMTQAFLRTRAAKTMLRPQRSEEHTSELQSLMRISYAVFCLKKKKNQKSIQELHSKINNTSESTITVVSKDMTKHTIR